MLSAVRHDNAQRPAPPHGFDDLLLLHITDMTISTLLPAGSSSGYYDKQSTVICQHLSNNIRLNCAIHLRKRDFLTFTHIGRCVLICAIMLVDVLSIKRYFVLGSN